MCVCVCVCVLALPLLYADPAPYINRLGVEMKKKYNRGDNTIDCCVNVFRSEIRGYILFATTGTKNLHRLRGEKKYQAYTIYICIDKEEYKIGFMAGIYCILFIY